MLPEPSPAIGLAGRNDVGCGIDQLKTRSLAAIADCRILYFSLRSWMGRKKRCAYWMKAMSTPMVTAFVHPRLRPADPKNQRDCRGAEDFNRRVIERISHDPVLEGDHVRAVNVLEVLVSAALTVEELHQGSCR